MYFPLLLVPLPFYLLYRYQIMSELKLKTPAGAESPVDPQPYEISCSQGGWAMSYFPAFVSQLNIAVVTKGKFVIW